MSYDNSFDRHDLNDPSRDRHDDPRDNDPYYGHERDRSDDRQQDSYYRMMEIYDSIRDAAVRRIERIYRDSMHHRDHSIRNDYSWYFE